MAQPCFFLGRRRENRDSAGEGAMPPAWAAIASPSRNEPVIMSVSSSPFSSALCRCKAVAALALLSLAALLPAQPSTEQRAPSLPAGCEVLRVEQGHKVSLHAYAIGVQTYQWNPSSQKWDFQGPTALLFADPGYRAVIGSHFSGPTWVTNSGSAVIGTRVDGRSPDATAIPWLLLRSVWNGGPGPLEGT